MPNPYKNGAFALGLVVGGGIALNLFLWLDYRANNIITANAEAEQNAENSQIGAFWDGLIGTFVSPSDTLAQWVMAFFTICATIVLIFTLRSANKTNSAAVKASNAALEANQIMRDEQRPWIKISDVKVTNEGDFLAEQGPGTRCLRFKFMISNLGPRPARNIRALAIDAVRYFVPNEEIPNRQKNIFETVAQAKQGGWSPIGGISTLAPNETQVVEGGTNFMFLKVLDEGESQRHEAYPALVIFLTYEDSFSGANKTFTTWAGYKVGSLDDSGGEHGLTQQNLDTFGGIKIVKDCGDIE